MIFTSGLSRMEGFIVPNEAKLLGLLGVCPVSESRIKRIELREGDTALRGIWLEVVEPAEVLGDLPRVRMECQTPIQIHGYWTGLQSHR